MKKIVGFFLVIILCFSLTACGLQMSADKALQVVLDDIGITEEQIDEYDVILAGKFLGSKYYISINMPNGDDYNYVINAITGKLISCTAGVSELTNNIIPGMPNLE